MCSRDDVQHLLDDAPPFGTCDAEGCGRPYSLTDRVIQCGDCGLCPKHCTHVPAGPEWDPDDAPMRDAFRAVTGTERRS